MDNEVVSNSLRPSGARQSAGPSRTCPLVVVALAWMAVWAAVAQPQTDPPMPATIEVQGTLVPGRAAEGVLGPGERHRWIVGTEDPGPWRLRAVPSMERAVLRLLSESGTEEWVHTTTFGFGWSHEIDLPEAGSGPWELEIEAAAKGAPVGAYTLTMARAAAPGPLRRAEQLESQALAQRPADDSEARTRAGTLLAEALALRRQLGDRRGEVRALLALAWVLRGREANRAAELLAEALVAAKSRPETATRALILDRLGHSHLGAGETEPALRSFVAAAGLWARLGYPAGETRALGSGCTVRVRQGEWHAAKRCLEQAISRTAALGLDRMEARLGISLGGVADHLGEPDLAIDALHRSLEAAQRFDDTLAEAQARNNLAALHRRLGEPSRALAQYRRALAGFERAGNLRWQARTVNNLGYVFLDLGHPERARPLLDRALELRREAGDRGGEAVTLRNLARAAAAVDDLAAGLTHARRALDLARDLESLRGEASAYELLGVLHAEGGDVGAARTAFDRAAERRSKIGDRRNLAWITLRRHDLGGELASGSEQSDAGADLAEAWQTFRSFREVAGETAALVALGDFDFELGKLERALGRFELAIEQVESVRTRIADPTQRALFFGARRRAYARAIDARLALHRIAPEVGHDRAALEISERSRARTLLESLDRPGLDPAGLDPAGLDPAVTERWRRARRQLGAKIERRTRELARGASDEVVRALDSEVEAARVELETVAQEVQGRDPRLATAPPLDFDGLRGLLDRDTGLLEIAFGETRSTAWWLTDRRLVVVDLPGRGTIEALAETTHNQLRRLDLTTRSTQREGARRLSNLLLAPLAEHLDRRRIVVVADGALDAVPWAALPDPRSPTGAPLLHRHEVVALPSASALAVLRRHARTSGSRSEIPGEWTVAILADPIFGPEDPRAPQDSSAPTGLPRVDRLPGTRDEALRIGQRLGERGRLFLGSDAHRDRLLGGSLRHFDALHFATHGLADPDFPELSGILLSTVDGEGRWQGGLLRPYDLQTLSLEARLVVLSGCGTALGRPVSGEGFLGLAHGFLDLGVPRVLASLWPVGDRATAELMDRFYGHLATPSISVAEALHRAQRDLAAIPRWSDPHYWAAFTLQGEWR